MPKMGSPLACGAAQSSDHLAQSNLRWTAQNISRNQSPAEDVYPVTWQQLGSTVVKPGDPSPSASCPTSPQAHAQCFTMPCIPSFHETFPTSLSNNRSVSHETIGDHSPDEKIQGESLLMQRAVREPVSQAVKLLALTLIAHGLSSKHAERACACCCERTFLKLHASMNKAPLKSSGFANSHVSATASCLIHSAKIGNLLNGSCRAGKNYVV